MIPVQQYLGTLRRRGIRLWLEGGNLRYQAPKNTLMPYDLVELRSRKPELIACLRESAPAVAPPVRPALRDGTPVFPQSFAQQRLWFLYRLNGPDAAYNIVDRRRLTGALDRAAFEAAFAALCRRHEVLRTKFDERDGTPVQIVSEGPGLDFAYIESCDAEGLAEAEARYCFDLTTGPLLRVRLVRLSAHEHVLLLTAHHIICDGWSLGLLFRELSALYRGAQLPAPALHYADFAVWQHGWLTGAALQSRLDYWRHLEGAPPVLDLFPDHPRVAGQNSNGAAEPIRIDADLATGLRKLCQARGCTPFMGMAAVFCTAIARYTKAREIVLGAQVTGRDLPDLEPIVGFFVNTLALRIEVQLDAPFEQLLERVRAVALDAVAHQDVPFDKVVERLRPERETGRNPLVQVMLLWQNLPAGDLEFEGLQLDGFGPAGRSTAKFDLTLEMGEGADGAFEGVLEYRTDLYTAREMRRLAGHLGSLVAGVVADSRRPLSAIPMVTEVERAALIHLGRGQMAAALPSTIAARFERRVLQHPHRPAVVFGSRTLSYGELDQRASILASRIGPRIEQPVALFFEPSIELIIGILAALKSGGFYLPLDTRSPRARLETVLADSGANTILTAEGLAHLLPPTAARVHVIDRETAFEVTPGHIESRPENLAYVIYTSGSTGTPKGVMIEQRSVVNLADWVGREAYAGMEAPVNTALLAPAVFDASVQQIFGCLLNGHTLYPVEAETRREGESLRRFFKNNLIGMADCTPSLLSIMCEAGIPEDDELSLRCLLVGGEGLHAGLAARVRRIALRNVYGPTECCVDTTCLTVDPARPSESIVSIGRALPNCHVFIAEDQMQLVPETVPGEIVIGGEGLGRGYWKRPALTAASFVPHPFEPGKRVYKTGDRGWWNASGNVEFLGRSDDQVKIRGYRIQLGDIETHLIRHSGVRQAAVQARTASEGHKELVAWFAGEDALTVAELRRFLAEALPEYMIPATFVRLEALPLNGSGKVDRRRLPAPEASLEAERGTEFIEPRTPEEAVLARVWSDVLGRKDIGVRDHYIALGGDSIKALRVSALLREAGWKMVLGDLFRHPHIEDLAPLLQPIHAAVSTAFASEAPLTPVQLRFFEEFDGARNFFGQTVLLAPSEALDGARLQTALQEVWLHHDALRSNFSNASGAWTQRIAEAVSSVPFCCVDCRTGDLPALTASLYAEMNLETGPLFRAVLCRVDAGERLLLVAHHLVIDGVSWRIVLEDLAIAYRASAPLPAKTTAFTNWSHSLRDPAIAAAAKFSWPAVDENRGRSCRARECGVFSMKLSKVLTAELLESGHRAYSTEANDLLLTALARAARLQSKRMSAAILLEGHGREPLNPAIDVSRTVGWFTALYPVLLDLGNTEDPGRHIKLVKEALRAIPHKGLGYGIARYIERDSRLNADPGLVFNYLGQFGGDSESRLFRRASEDTGPMADPDASFPHDVEINALASGGILEFHFSYNPNRSGKEAVTALADSFLREMETLAEHTRNRLQTELTPSDTDYDGFSLDEMESFLDQLSAAKGH